MAQPNTAQREPSMEEILASIRRIIEDSEGGRKGDEAPKVARPDNDFAAPAPPSRSQTEEIGTVLDVESFRTELRGPARSAPAAPLFSPERMDPVEPGAGARDDKAQMIEPAAAMPKASAYALPSVDDWRLGTPEPAARANEPESAAPFGFGSVDAMLEDAIAADRLAVNPAQVGNDFDARPSAEAADADRDPGAQRNAIISDHAGRQVAAAFGELAGAFAARSQKSIESTAEDLLRPMLQDWLDNNLPHLVERLVREEIERVARGG